jgi:hypothetical protein
MVVSPVVAGSRIGVLVGRSCNVDRYEAVCVTRRALHLTIRFFARSLPGGGGITKFCVASSKDASLPVIMRSLERKIYAFTRKSEGIILK